MLRQGERVMVSDILRIKTNLPPLTANILARPQIQERLNRGLSTPEGFAWPLTVISAPAGFGKTTLARAWVAKTDAQAAWYSLDHQDNERERFWLYFAAALQTIDPELGRGTREALHSAGPIAPSQAAPAFLTALLNDLFECGRALFLVLDDYHVIENRDIHQDMVFFLEHAPPTVHVVVTSRSDPPWPLARWRGKGRMEEVRLADLQFSEEEAAELFQGLQLSSLSSSQIRALHRKTEGWITGLHLAALSLTRVDNVEQFIESFTGSQRHILHFLSEEVFFQQPESRRDFLCKTAVLHRFHGPLCHALTGREDSSEILCELERDNVFVIPLDEEGTWYRYHPLFAEQLRYHLQRTEPQAADDLHRKAGQWFLNNGEPGEAVRYALAAGDLAQVGAILHEHYDSIRITDGWKHLNRCLEALPDNILQKHPSLAVHKVLYCLIYRGYDEAQRCIALAESLGYEDPETHAGFRGTLEAVKAYYHVCRNQFEVARETAERALELLPEHNHYWLMNAAIYSGDSWLFTDNPQRADEFYQQAHLSGRRVMNPSLTTGFKRATSLACLGRFREAEELITQLLKEARQTGYDRIPRIGLLWTLLAEIKREAGHLPEAERCLERGLHFSEPETPSFCWNLLTKAAFCMSTQDYDAAVRVAADIEEINRDLALPLFITDNAAVWKGFALLALGRPDGAGGVLERLQTNSDGPVAPGQGRGRLLAVHWNAAQPEPPQHRCRSMLREVQALAEQGQYRRLWLESQLTLSVLEHRWGNDAAADEALDEALQIGKPCGFYQTFIDYGRECAAVWQRLLHRRGSADHELAGWIRQLMDDMHPPAASQRLADRSGNGKDGERAAEAAADVPGAADGLIEALSEREREVLQLISEGLSNEAIAQTLYLSLGTVKWHTSNIYGKLGVRNRTRAAAMARQMQLLP